MQLKSTESLIDFLKSVHHDSDFSTRKKIFNAHELDKRLGKYAGTDIQNRALEKMVRSFSDKEQAHGST